jgi:hypothetical protein
MLTSRRAALCTIALLTLLPAFAAFGHHSFTAEFDVNKPVTVSGTVTKVEWTNPHAWIYIDAAGPDGKVGPWEIELGSPNTLLRYKWRRDTAKVGTTLTVDGYLSRDGLNRVNAKSITLGDGTTFEAGSSALQSTR